MALTNNRGPRSPADPSQRLPNSTGGAGQIWRDIHCATLYVMSSRKNEKHARPTTIRLPDDLKKDSNEIFEKLGISMSAAINIFLKAVVREGGIPFGLKAESNATKPAPGNATLNRATTSKRDEFYTQYEDIELEMAHYAKELRGKTILCNCDDPFESAFFRYFATHFQKLGLKKLISTCYSTSPIAGNEYPLEGGAGAYKAVITEVPDEDLLRPDGALDLEPLLTLPGNTLTRLQGDGDFRSEECIDLLKKADIVVTNPPFSLFREYINQLIEYRKKFVILGNVNAVTYKEVFPLFSQNKLWFGESIRSGDRKFHVPDNYPLNAAGCGIDESGRRYIRVKGVRWFTNIENQRRFEQLPLTETYFPSRYPTYENYDAIEVGRTAEIPVDYQGIMGVPITFLDKYNPDQFDILMLANGNARTSVEPQTLRQAGYRAHPEDRGGVGVVDGKRVYARILIRRTRR